MIKRILKSGILFFVLTVYLQAASGQDPVRALVDEIENNPEPLSVSQEELRVNDNDLVQSCIATVRKSIKNCREPQGNMWKKGLSIMSSGFTAAEGFLKMGGASSSLSKVCEAAKYLGILNSLFNGGRSDTCDNAKSVCEEMCNETALNFLEHERSELMKESPSQEIFTRISEIDRQIERVERYYGECIRVADDESGKSQLQAQVNTNILQKSMQSCEDMLKTDESDDEESVDCLDVARYGSHPLCTDITEGGGDVHSESEPVNDGNVDDDFTPDFPEDRGLANNKTRSGGPSKTPSSGGGALGTGGSSSNGGGLSKTGGSGQRSRGKVGLLFGKSTGGEGGSGFSHDGDGSDKNSLTELAKKKGKIGLLTPKKKIAGNGLISSQFGLASRDIWTSVYIRTNARCAKQLKECSANRSRDPYGGIRGGKK